MPTYNYIAPNNNGTKKKGILSASSEREARKYIKDLQLTPKSVAISTSRTSFRSKIKNKEIDENITSFINRLSDYFFILARKIAVDLEVPETPWVPDK